MTQDIMTHIVYNALLMIYLVFLKYLIPLVKEYISLHDKWVNECDGFLLVYSIAKRRTFEGIEKFHNHVTRTKDSVQVPIILVGNGCEQAIGREVSIEEGENLAKRLKCEFFETSSKQRINVCRAFYSLIRMIRQDDGMSKRNIKKRKTFRYLFRRISWLMSDLVYLADK
ncbi:13380_t:CDS:2 [Racocetra persica]|uniref:13380_t:CDS:1 n=1 Tax=Racocetra persica TaxID=160502 RepID=A0ACA9L824_9GLOM|nr:13380_t:CDS:2 [Racocetra persica]